MVIGSVFLGVAKTSLVQEKLLELWVLVCSPGEGMQSRVVGWGFKKC